MQEKPKRFNRIRNVVLYSRFDPEELHCPSFEVQEDVMFKWAEKEGYSVVGAYRETVSGMLDIYSRPVLYEAKQTVSKLSRTMLISSDYNILSINTYTICKQLSSASAYFVACNSGYVPDNFVVQMQSLFNEENWRKTVTSKGENPDDIKWQINEIGRLLFASIRKESVNRMLARGDSYQTIADSYNHLNMGTQEGDSWEEKDVAKLITYFR
jgi:hypothetical protein